jgi:bifunctional non-homologous end joining protein LigD
MALDEYNRKRDFQITSEPSGAVPPKPRKDGARGFVIQKHAASHLHYDFRLELEGVLKSWSVPKGPSLDPKVKRLAMHVEDHPIAYADFEGIIPKGQYGGGTVMLWDRGTWEPVGDPHRDYAAGNLKFVLKGEKLQGGFALIRIGDRGGRRGGDERSWLLIKERDAYVRPEADAGITEELPNSVSTGRTMDEIARQRERVWHSKTSHLEVADVDGAKSAPLPKTPRPPAFATRIKPPAGKGWLHEIGVDGERVLARNDGKAVKLYDAAGKPLSAAAARRRETVAAAVRMLPAQTLIVDGILTAALPDGRTDADQLDRALGEGKRGGHARADVTPAYFVFDLPYLDGRDLSDVPLERRKALLAELVRRASEHGPIRYLDHVATEAQKFAKEAAKLGITAMVSRAADSRYAPRAPWSRSPLPLSAKPKR